MPPLLADWDTETVLLVPPDEHMGVYDRHLPELRAFYAEFLAEIGRHDAAIGVLADDAPPLADGDEEPPVGVRWCRARIADIWVRDFAPLPTTDGGTGFIYEPPYAPRRHSREVRQSFSRFLASQLRPGPGTAAALDLRLEGGNLTHNGAGVAVMTDRILSRNRNRGRPQIERLLKDALALERLVIVPTEPGDRFGHVDGMMRWISPDQIMINDYSALATSDRSFAGRLLRILDQELPQVERCIVPYPFSTRTYRGWPDATGNYVNFLRTRNRVHVPLYGLAEDAAVREIFESRFAGRVSWLRPGVLARYGGVLNCVTWAFRVDDGAASTNPWFSGDSSACILAGGRHYRRATPSEGDRKCPPFRHWSGRMPCSRC